MKKIAIYNNEEERTQKQGWNVVFNNLFLLDTTIARLTEKCKRFLKNFSYRSRKITLFHKNVAKSDRGTQRMGNSAPGGELYTAKPGGALQWEDASNALQAPGAVLR